MRAVLVYLCRGRVLYLGIPPICAPCIDWMVARVGRPTHAFFVEYIKVEHGRGKIGLADPDSGISTLVPG